MASADDLLLVICPPWGIHTPHLGLAYLSAFIRSSGFQVDIVDLSIKCYRALCDGDGDGDGHLKRRWGVETHEPQIGHVIFEEASELVDQLVERVVTSGTRLLGFSVNVANIGFTERVVQRIRAAGADAHIVYGGPELMPAMRTGKLAQYSADAYVIGDGELTLLELMRRRDGEGRLAATPGAALPGRLDAFEPRAPVMDLGTLPFPTYEECDLSEYAVDASGVPYLPLLTSRGCIGKCSFCVDHIISGRHRVRPAAQVVEELRHHTRRYGITRFHFNDLVCNGRPRELWRICEAIIAAKLEVVWWSYARAHRDMTPEVFRTLRASGCELLIFGLESGSDRVLRLMNKGFDRRTAEESIRACSKAGITTSVDIVIGFPGETREDHEQTIDFIRRNRRYIDSITNLNELILIQGTDLAMRPGEHGVSFEERRPTWYAADGNTLEERARRQDEMLQLMQTLGIPVTNMHRELALPSRPAGGPQRRQGAP